MLFVCWFFVGFFVVVVVFWFWVLWGFLFLFCFVFCRILVEAGQEIEEMWETAITYEREIRCDRRVTHKVMEKFGRMQRIMFRLWKCHNIKHNQRFVPRVTLRISGLRVARGKHCSDSLTATAGLKKYIDFTSTSDFTKFYLLTSTRDSFEDCHINICFERKCKKQTKQNNLTTSPTPTLKPCLRLYCLRGLTFSFKPQHATPSRQ